MPESEKIIWRIVLKGGKKYAETVAGKNKIDSPKKIPEWCPLEDVD